MSCNSNYKQLCNLLSLLSIRNMFYYLYIIDYEISISLCASMYANICKFCSNEKHFTCRNGAVMKVYLMVLSLFLKTEAESMLPGLTLHMENEG